MSAPRGRLGGYALWQLRDYIFGPGALTILVALMVLIPVLVGKNVAVSHGASVSEIERSFGRAFDQVLALVATAGALLGVANLASADRHPGLTRFLFAKPVTVRGYYLQAWFVRALALGVISLAIAFAFDQFIAPISVLGAVTAVGMSWLLIAGAGVLLSVLIPRDGIVVLLMYMVPTALAAIIKSGATWWWLKPTLTIMPPTHKLEAFRAAVLGTGDVVPADAWHMALYGAACVALAAYLVRRFPLVR